MSGIPRLIERLAGNPLFGMVRLTKTERSAVAACAGYRRILRTGSWQERTEKPVPA